MVGNKTGEVGRAVGRSVGVYGPVVQLGAVPKGVVLHAIYRLDDLVASCTLANLRSSRT